MLLRERLHGAWMHSRRRHWRGTRFKTGPASSQVVADAVQLQAQALQLLTRLAVKNVVGEAGYAIPADSKGQFNAKPVWVLAHRNHCSSKRRKISCTQSGTLSFVIGHMLKVFNPRLFAEEITHLAKLGPGCLLRQKIRVG